MATWKKVVISGSDISQLNNDAGFITSVTAQHAFNTASYSGTEITAGSSNGNLIFDNNGTDGLTISADAGTDTLTFGLSAIPNSSLANSTISGVSLGSNLSDLSPTANGGLEMSANYNGSAASEIKLNLSALSVEPIDVAADSLAFAQPGDTFDKLTSVVDFVGSIAGSGLTANNGVLSADFSGDITAVLAGDGITVTNSTGPEPTVTLNTGSAHFIGGARKTISVSDTTGASGIDLTYNNSTGVLSGVLQNSSITLGTTSINLGATSTTLAGLTSVTSTTFVGDLTGNADTATSALSADSVAAGDIVGDIALGTQTSGNYVATLGTGTGVTIGANTGEGSTPTIAVNYGSSANTAVEGDTTITINGTSNEIEITGTAAQALGGAPSYTVGLPDDVTIQGDLIVSNDLTVIGTASFQHTENLDIADRFIRMASGSTSPGDGGIVVQQDNPTNGEAFGWDNATSRWGIQKSFDATSSTMSPDAFMAAVVTGDGSTNAEISAHLAGLGDERYEAKGNIFIDNASENIWIYS